MMFAPILIKETCRAGRAMADLSQRDLAQEAHVSESTVRDFEKGRRTPSHNNLMALQRALEGHGIEFTKAQLDDYGPGVRLNRRSVAEQPAQGPEDPKRHTDNPFEEMHALLQDLQEKKNKPS